MSNVPAKRSTDNPPLRSFSSLYPSRETWTKRVRENLCQLLSPARLTPTLANGAPIHLVKIERRGRTGRAQSASLLAHVSAIAAILLLAAQGRRNATSVRPGKATEPGHLGVRSIPILDRRLFGRPSDGSGSGGGLNPIPATRGELPPRSSVQIVPPWQPQNSRPRFVANATLLDPEAAPLTNVPFAELGLPWMKDYTNSAGPGGPHGYGSTPGRTLGDGEKGPAGRGSGPSPYRPGLTQPMCQYCPDPTYSDEARKAKLQGSVTLEVLVDADGRTAHIRVARGLGFGLDEKAEEAVRAWHFVPARDAAGRGVPAWVTIEVTFHLF